jgi:hypothetical protein
MIVIANIETVSGGKNMIGTYGRLIEDAVYIYKEIDGRLNGNTQIKPTPEAIASLTATVIINHEKNERVREMKGEREPVDKTKLLKELHDKMNKYPSVEIKEIDGKIIVKKTGNKMDIQLFDSYKTDLKSLGFTWDKFGNCWTLKV